MKSWNKQILILSESVKHDDFNTPKATLESYKRVVLNFTLKFHEFQVTFKVRLIA